MGQETSLHRLREPKDQVSQTVRICGEHCRWEYGYGGLQLIEKVAGNRSKKTHCTPAL